MQCQKNVWFWEEAGLKVWQFWNYAAGEVSKAENLGIFIRCDEAKAVRGKHDQSSTVENTKIKN